jgi:hypothetical protein
MVTKKQAAARAGGRGSNPRTTDYESVAFGVCSVKL